MNFEWDANKAETNRQKHGVTFQEAATVFQDVDALQIFDPDHSEDDHPAGDERGSADSGGLPLLSRQRRCDPDHFRAESDPE